MRHVIFDLDYTLVYSGDYQAIFSDMAAKLGIAEDEAINYWQSHGGCPLREQISDISGLDLNNPIVAELEKYFWHEAGDVEFSELDEASTVLKTLQERGHILFLSTGSNPKKMNQCLDQMGWHDYFFLAQGSTADNPKGDSHYKNIASALGLPVKDLGPTSAAIGDGAYDMRFARNHNLALRLGYTPPGTDQSHIELLRNEGAHDTVDDLRELLNLLSAE